MLFTPHWPTHAQRNDFLPSLLFAFNRDPCMLISPEPTHSAGGIIYTICCDAQETGASGLYLLSYKSLD